MSKPLTFEMFRELVMQDDSPALREMTRIASHRLRQELDKPLVPLWQQCTAIQDRPIAPQTESVLTLTMLRRLRDEVMGWESPRWVPNELSHLLLFTKPSSVVINPTP